MPESPKTRKALAARARRRNPEGLREWDRLDHEPPAAWEAFQAYRNMGLDRSLPKVGKELDKAVSTLGTYSTKFSWVLRAAAWDAEQDRKDQLYFEKERRKAAVRHVRQAQALTNKWVQRLQTLDPADLSPSEVIRFAEVATRMEREALGMAERAMRVEVSGQVAVTNGLSPEDTDVRLRALQREISERLEGADAAKELVAGAAYSEEVLDAEVVEDDGSADTAQPMDVAEAEAEGKDVDESEES